MKSPEGQSSEQPENRRIIPDVDGNDRYVSVQIEKVTPEEASEYLEQNERNRPLSEGNVKRFAELMGEGRWFLTQDAIAFDYDGYLINGQNRLHAVIECGSPQYFLVMRGLHPESFQVMDYGKKRSASDALAVRGYTNFKSLAAVGRLLWQYENGTLSNTRPKCENMDIVDLVDRHGERLTEAISYMTKIEAELAGWLRPRHLGMVYYLYTFRDEDKARKFAYNLAMRSASGRDNPVRRLYVRLMDEMRSPDRMDARLERALLIKSANKYMNGEDVKVLRWSPGGGERFPEPDLRGNYPFETNS